MPRIDIEEEKPNLRQVRKQRKELEKLAERVRLKGACSTIRLNVRLRSLLKMAIKLYTDILTDCTSDIANNLAFKPKLHYKLDAQRGVLRLEYADPYFTYYYGLAIVCLAQYKFPEDVLTAEFQKIGLNLREVLKQTQLEIRGR